MSAEKQRLLNNQWKKWGPYVSNRQWATVREDYSHDGEAWNFTTYEKAQRKVFRWGEDGIGGICDDEQLLCFAVSFWNKRDPLIKERLFGLSNREGNHGEDVKELYYYVDSTPTHSYMKMLYKYPQHEFPYWHLLNENHKRGRHDPEFELWDTGIFNSKNYFDVFIEYAKNDVNDFLIKFTIHNRGGETAPINVLPTVWFRNTWIWGDDAYKPELNIREDQIHISHRKLGEMMLYSEFKVPALFCDNESNPHWRQRHEKTGFFKDGINDFLINGNEGSINMNQSGTKAAFNNDLTVEPNSSVEIHLRLAPAGKSPPFENFQDIFNQRKSEADEFYSELQRNITHEDAKSVQRQALAGMLWNKQFYYYDVDVWINGDPGKPTSPQRQKGRNHKWLHLHNSDIISMPDKWEYPWYAAWDLAFHCIPLALVDPDFAKQQLLLLTRERYMHPNGQLPAYEWDFGDVNPPVHAWAAWEIYRMDQNNTGKGDIHFLESIFHKLLLNFTWWVNRKDTAGNNIFQGGFLGLDNIGVFDRNAKLPHGGHMEQADGTSWMALFSLNMLRISLELSKNNPVYQDMATKFFEHFLYIAGAMAHMGESHSGLWDEHDGFFYDQVRTKDYAIQLKIRSMVGLIPFFAVDVLDDEILQRSPDFKERMGWFMKNRPDLAGLVSRLEETNVNEKHLLSLLRPVGIKKILHRMLDETEFLSEFGIRSLSKFHKDNPYKVKIKKKKFSIEYTPGESTNNMFGGNSNWRGPVWMPLNFMIIESLRKFHYYYYDDLKVECPTGSGNFMNLKEVATELTKRLSRLFLLNEKNQRVFFGEGDLFHHDPHFRDYLMFHEYFHGDTGKGLGASQQTGWTGLIAELLRR